MKISPKLNSQKTLTWHFSQSLPSPKHSTLKKFGLVVHINVSLYLSLVPNSRVDMKMKTANASYFERRVCRKRDPRKVGVFAMVTPPMNPCVLPVTLSITLCHWGKALAVSPCVVPIGSWFYLHRVMRQALSPVGHSLLILCIKPSTALPVLLGEARPHSELWGESGVYHSEGQPRVGSRSGPLNFLITYKPTTFTWQLRVRQQVVVGGSPSQIWIVAHKLQAMPPADMKWKSSTYTLCIKKSTLKDAQMNGKHLFVSCISA